jgi:uncharacterized protein involved in outer membrane biogenesis
VAEPFSILELRRQTGARGRRGHHWRNALIVVAALLLLFNLIGFFVAPPIIKRQLERRLGEALHRQVAIRALHLNPYVFSTTIDGLAINDPDGRLLFGCERLYVNFDSWSFLAGKWIFQEISVDAPTARLEVRKDGTLNISDLLAPSAEKPVAPPARPRPLVIGQLAVTQARFAFADHSRAQDFATELGPLSFSLKDFSTAPAPGAPYEFTASTESGEALHWRGTLSADPLRSAGEFTLGQIALKKYAPYYAGAMRGEVLAGTLDVAGHYELDLSVEPRVMKLTGGELHLHGLQLAPQGIAAPVLALPAVDLTGLNASLAPLKISLAKFALTGGQVALQRAADGTFNLVTMFMPPANGGTPVSAQAAAAPAPAGPLDVSLASLEVHGLALAFDDATTPRPAHNTIASLDLSAQNLSLAPSAPPVPFKLALRFAPQGALNLGGTFALSPLHADLAVDLTDFPLAGASPYIEPFVDLRIAQGTASAHGQFTFATGADAKPSIAFHGDAGVDRVITVDAAAGEDFASLVSLGLKQLDFTSAPLGLNIAQVSLSEPSFHFTVHRDGTTNLAAVLRSEPAAEGQNSAEKAAASPAPKITIGHVMLADGTLVLADRSIEPNARIAINQIAGSLAGLSSADYAHADVDLRAMVDNSSPVAIAGQINPFGSDASTDLTVTCAAVDLVPAGTYVGKYAGYALAQGNLSLDLKVRLAQRRLDSQNVATLNQFTLGEKTSSPDATGLPVRLAIALLKDSSGKIVIDLPVQGRLDDPDFRVGRVVLRVIVNLLTKAATAPFAVLGSMFGGGSQQLDQIDFAPGVSTLTATETSKLDVIVRALVARPGLNLDLTGAADADGDTPVLQKQKLTQLIRAKIWRSHSNTDSQLPPLDQLQVAPEEFNQVLTTLYFTTFPPPRNLQNTAPPAPPGPGHDYSRTPAAKSVSKAGSDNSAAPQPSLFGRIIDFFRGGPKKSPAPDEKQPAEAVSTPAPPPAGENPVPPSRVIIQPAEMMERLAAQLPIGDDDLRQLAAARAQGVKDYLIAQGVPTERVFLTDTGPGTAPVPSAPRVTLHLK